MADGNGASHCHNFETFFNGWLTRQENFLEQLVQALTSQEFGHEIERLGSLIQEVLSHYERYLEEKFKEAKGVFLFYSPPWLSSFEKTFLWVGGFKPFLLFKLLANLGTELTPEQDESIERLKYETRIEERELTEAMATIQESTVTLPLLNLVRRFGRLTDGEALELESAMETLKVGMLKTLEKADKLRSSTVKKLIEILSPVQTVKFLAASAEFQLRVRKWGLQRETGLGRSACRESI
ncbi:hypothetical protein DITRI_Ditri10aG0059800 [Diplodiscus trichospermus]